MLYIRCNFCHRPYIIDLESTNGTYVNNNRIDAARYYELKEGVSLPSASGGYIVIDWTSNVRCTFLCRT